MKNSLLRKFIENLDALPREELIRLINSELDESELLSITTVRSSHSFQRERARRDGIKRILFHLLLQIGIF